MPLETEPHQHCGCGPVEESVQMSREPRVIHVIARYRGIILYRMNELFIEIDGRLAKHTIIHRLVLNSNG